MAGGFLAAYESYLRRELGFANATGAIFYLSGGGVGTFTSTGNDDASLAARVRPKPPSAPVRGRRSYFDLDVPFYATEFTLAHLNVSPEVRARNITVASLRGRPDGLLDDAALARLQADLARFIADAASPARR